MSPSQAAERNTCCDQGRLKIWIYLTAEWEAGCWPKKTTLPWQTKKKKAQKKSRSSLNTSITSFPVDVQVAACLSAKSSIINHPYSSTQLYSLNWLLLIGVEVNNYSRQNGSFLWRPEFYRERNSSVFNVIPNQLFLFWVKQSGRAETKQEPLLCPSVMSVLVLSKGRLSKGTAFVLGTGRSAHTHWPFLLTSFVYIHIDAGTTLCGRTNKNTNMQAHTQACTHAHAHKQPCRPRSGQ